MSLVKCKECGGQLSTTAISCPHCGAKTPKRRGLVSWLILGIIGIGVINITVAMLTKAPVDPAVEAEERRKQAATDKLMSALISAQREVKEQLKDPDSARFGVVTLGRNNYVCGYVNAKNSFGAYSGEREFLSAEPYIAAWINDSSEAFKESWAKNCGR